MSQAVHLEVFYPHPPERVWQVLTDRRVLADWMMENNFEPKLGHRFQFYAQPLPGLTSIIECEVVELEEPTRLVYTWRESPTAEPSLVIWTLTTVAGGTQVRLKHHQHSYAYAVATLNRSGTPNTHRANHTAEKTAHFYGDHLSTTSVLEAPSRYSTSRNITQSLPSGIATALELFEFQPFNWDYYLNHQLPKTL
ncbi:SRPBCC domain-containing protein [Oscillatoria sp. FACHB-1407]|uniref:SRPBCC family protein n=1 Tax=Oscillatoria sp. FACHB-1407 TaxID=2692847 RepID=UPI0016862334|nr:SRPBCC domain-containing protein [Oscillatoria sp. FACHB-1407]MBD2464664.1 SRPBCC domain-containing protein [Oscillatoria sp. FACHB-1407]